MAAPGPKKRLALDTNVLLALAEDRDYAHEFRERFQAVGYYVRQLGFTLQMPISDAGFICITTRPIIRN